MLAAEVGRSVEVRGSTLPIVTCPGCRRPLPGLGPRCGPCTALAWLGLGLGPSDAQRDVTGSEGRASPDVQK
jgi:hypothetical protein